MDRRRLTGQGPASRQNDDREDVTESRHVNRWSSPTRLFIRSSSSSWRVMQPPRQLQQYYYSCAMETNHFGLLIPRVPSRYWTPCQCDVTRTERGFKREREREREVRGGRIRVTAEKRAVVKHSYTVSWEPQTPSSFSLLLLAAAAAAMWRQMLANGDDSAPASAQLSIALPWYCSRHPTAHIYQRHPPPPTQDCTREIESITDRSGTSGRLILLIKRINMIV